MTLHTDETTKFCTKYLGSQIATADRLFSLGLVTTKSGSAQHTFDGLVQMLEDIDRTVTQGGLGTAVSSKIVSAVKNTMSDRSIVEKNFNVLLQSFRKEILPSVTKSWDELQKSCNCCATA